MSKRIVSYWFLVTLTLVVGGTMAIWSLPYLAEQAGAPVFDLRPSGYELAQARALIGAFSTDDIAFYLNVQQWLDTAFPPLLCLVLVWSTLWAARDLKLSIRVAFCMFAVAGMSFDWLENQSVRTMLQTPVDSLTADMVAHASRLTVLKSVANTVAYSLLLLLWVRLVWLRFRGQPKPQKM